MTVTHLRQVSCCACQLRFQLSALTLQDLCRLTGFELHLSHSCYNPISLLLLCEISFIRHVLHEGMSQELCFELLAYRQSSKGTKRHFTNM